MVLGAVEIEEVAGNGHEGKKEFEEAWAGAGRRGAVRSACACWLEHASWAVALGAVAVRLLP